MAPIAVNNGIVALAGYVSEPEGGYRAVMTLLPIGASHDVARAMDRGAVGIAVDVDPEAVSPAPISTNTFNTSDATPAAAAREYRARVAAAFGQEAAEKLSSKGRIEPGFKRPAGYTGVSSVADPTVVIDIPDSAFEAFGRQGPRWSRVAIGITVALIAASISLGSYEAASSAGGTVVVLWGAVLWGGWIALKGLFPSAN